jgi:hypothetical protein
VRPRKELGPFLEGDRPVFAAEHEPGLVGVVFGDRVAVFGHEHMFAWGVKEAPRDSRSVEPAGRAGYLRGSPALLGFAPDGSRTVSGAPEAFP